MKIALMFLIFLANPVVTSIALGSTTARCLFNFHTLIYPSTGHVGYELMAYPAANDTLNWALVTYEMFPKREVSRISVQAVRWGDHEGYNGVDKNGKRISIVIDRSQSGWSAPFMYRAYVQPDVNSTPSHKAIYSAQRINPQYPNEVGGGILGRLDICN